MEHIDTIVIGAGQSGLSVGYHLSRRGIPFLILEARDRIGDVWRERWDSLRLFTPSRFSSLDGMPMPAPHGNWFAPKDDVADYLEAYARKFSLRVRTGVRVDRLSRRGDEFVVEAGGERWTARNVVVAMANYQKPWVPAFAADLDPSIVQIHSFDYRNPAQLREGPVLIVGAGNSGSEIAMEVAPRHAVRMSGRDTGQLPFRVAGLAGRLILVWLVLRVIFHRVLTVRTPLGRRVRPKVVHRGGPLIRVKNKDLAAAGVERVPSMKGVENGAPVLADGRRLEVQNVVWCTGFRPGFDWIDLPIFREGDPEPDHRSGTVEKEPGLFFVGLHFLHALSSGMIHGVGRDADRIAGAIAARRRKAVAPRPDKSSAAVLAG